MNDANTGRPVWKTTDFLLAACGIAVSVAVYVGSDGYPDLPWNMGGPPGFFPQMLAVALAILSICVLVEGWLHPTPFSRPQAGQLRCILGALAVFALVPLLLQFAGFRATAVLMAFSIMLVVGGREYLTWRGVAVMFAVAVVASFGLHFAFEDLAGRRLPAGSLFR